MLLVGPAGLARVEAMFAQDAAAVPDAPHDAFAPLWKLERRASDLARKPEAKDTAQQHTATRSAKESPLARKTKARHRKALQQAWRVAHGVQAAAAFAEQVGDTAEGSAVQDAATASSLQQQQQSAPGTDQLSSQQPADTARRFTRRLQVSLIKEALLCPLEFDESDVNGVESWYRPFLVTAVQSTRETRARLSLSLSLFGAFKIEQTLARFSPCRTHERLVLDKSACLFQIGLERERETHKARAPPSLRL